MNPFIARRFFLRAALVILLAIPGGDGHAQSAIDYILIPGASCMLPVDAQMKLDVDWYGADGTLHEGVNAFSARQLPEWSINGRPATLQDPSAGLLSVDLTLDRATYTAPPGIPKTNPVTIAVKFHSSDTSTEVVTLVCQVRIVDPGNRWYVSFTYKSSSAEADRSATSLRTSNSRIWGSASMLILAAPPDPGGQVTINTSEGDSIMSYSSAGQWAESIREISKDLSGTVIEKTIRDHEGTVSTDQNGIEFEYDPAPGGIRGLAGAGLGFSGGGKELFYSLDDQNRLALKDENDGPFGTHILLGHGRDVLKKTTDGFTIDYREQQDTSYTDALGHLHTARGEVTYHVTISRKKEHRAAPPSRKDP